MEYRRGTRIVMDEDKIKREGIYDLENIYKDIDNMAEYAGLIDLAALGIFNFMNLVEEEWFTKNVKEWTWIDRKEGNTDLIESCKKSNEGIWA